MNSLSFSLKVITLAKNFKTKPNKKMKNIKSILATLFVAVALFATQSLSAQCTIQSLDSAGLDPRWQDLACVQRGVAYDEVINIKNFDSLGTITVNWLRVDSLAPIYDNNVARPFTGLPAGINWQMNVPTGNPANTLNRDENGCIQISGTSNAPRGDYRIGIYVTVNTSLIELSGEAADLVDQIGPLIGGGGNLPNFAYFSRVIEPTETCPDSLLLTSVKDLKNVNGLNISPNPISSTAVISFASTENASYTVRMIDIVGKEVFNEKWNVNAGNNRFELNKGDLNRGIYIFTISDGRSVATRRVIIE